MSYRSIAVRTGLLAAVLAVSGASLSAQVRRPLPTTMTPPRVVIAPRVYTPAEFRARFHALPNSATLLAKINADAIATPGKAGSGPQVQLRDLPTTTGGSTGLGTIGATTTLSPATPVGDNPGQWRAWINAYNVAFASSSVTNEILLRPGSSILVGIYAPGNWSGFATYVVIFDFYPGAGMSSLPSSLSLSTGNPGQPAGTCTAAQLQSSVSDGVVSCAVTVSGSFSQNNGVMVSLSAPASWTNGMQWVDVAVMRVR